MKVHLSNIVYQMRVPFHLKNINSIITNKQGNCYQKPVAPTCGRKRNSYASTALLLHRLLSANKRTDSYKSSLAGHHMSTHRELPAPMYPAMVFKEATGQREKYDWTDQEHLIIISHDYRYHAVRRWSIKVSLTSLLVTPERYSRGDSWGTRVGRMKTTNRGAYTHDNTSHSVNSQWIQVQFQRYLITCRVMALHRELISFAGLIPTF